MYALTGGSITVAAGAFGGLVAIREIQLQNNAFDQATVDLILNVFAENEADFTYATPSVDLSGTDAAPSAAGLTDKATLIAAGWSVTTK